MALKDTLTNEKLNDRFDNPFVLVTYAIDMATRKVHRGEGIDSNPAVDVLEIIAMGHDLLQEDEEEELEEENATKKSSNHLSTSVR